MRPDNLLPHTCSMVIALPPSQTPHGALPLPTHLALILHVLDNRPGATVVELTDGLTPFRLPATPITQLSVRTGLKILMEAGLVETVHKGKPRTYIRTQASYRVQPAEWKPPNLKPMKR